MLTIPSQSVCFGTSQHRTLFPLHCAPNRLQVHIPHRGLPHLGPGSYHNDEFGTIFYEVQKKPVSNRGYSLSARTAVRFPCNKTVTPSPWQYQDDQSLSRVIPPAKAPFNSTAKRFKHVSRTSEETPGPGTYAHDDETNRKVTWPMCFGRPDWSKLPPIEKRPLRVKLASDIEHLKQRNRVAYLSLYY